MRCEHIEIVNFCQHRYRDVTFSEGLTAIIGPNGSGKSNFLGAIRFALTGENPNVGAKLANVCDIAPSSENSYVELTFSHGGVRATVRRNLRPARPTAVLTIEGGDRIEGDKDVTARIEQILSINTDIINDIMIVAQDEIFGFLDKTPAKRAEQFQRLFHTEKAAVVHKIIGDQLKTVEIPAVGVDIDELRVAITQHDQRARSLEGQLANVPGFQEIQQHRDENSAVVRHFEERSRLQQQLTQLSQQRHQAEQARQQQRAQLEQYQDELDTVQAAADGNREAAQQARVTLGQLSTKREQIVARNRCVETIQSIEAAIAQIEEPTKPDDYEDYAALGQQISTLVGQRQHLERFVNSFHDGVAECPTCGTPTSNLEEKLTDARAQIAQMQEQEQRLRDQQQRAGEYDKAVTAAENAKANFRTRLENTQQHLATIPEVSVDDVDESALRQAITNEGTFNEGVREYQQLIGQANSTISRYDGQIETLTQQIDNASQNLATTPEYTQEQAQQASANVSGWDRAAENRRQWESEITIAKTNKAQSKQQLEQAMQVKRQADVLRNWHEFAQEMRGIVHKDAAPRFVAQRNLRRLQHSMNENLAMFDTNYRVEADEGLSFEAMFNHGSRQPAERLSEGQKVVLALSFRLALNLMFAEDVGALYLDEPTAYLDEHHIRGFEPVLDQLKEYSAARGLQCMIITHERDLAPLFDSVIQL